MFYHRHCARTNQSLNRSVMSNPTTGYRRILGCLWLRLQQRRIHYYMMNTVAAHFNNEHHVPGHEECICPRGGSLYLKMPSMISMVGFQVFYNPSIGILALTSEGYLKKKRYPMWTAASAKRYTHYQHLAESAILLTLSRILNGGGNMAILLLSFGSRVF